MVLLFFQHTFLLTSMWRQIFCPGIGYFQSGTFPLRWHRQLFIFGAFQRWTLLASSCSTQCQHYFTLETPLPLGALGLNVFSHPWNFQVSYMFPPLALVPLVVSTFLAEHVSGQLRHLLLVAPCWMEAPWASHSSQHVGRCSSVVSHHKRSCCGCFSRPGTQGSAISAFNLWLLSDVCYANRDSLPWSVRQWQGQLEHLCQGSTSSAGRNWLVGVLDRVYQKMPSLPLN